jgi:hypothetical protein
LASTIVPSRLHTPTASAPPTVEAPASKGVDWRLLLLGLMVVSAVYVAWHLGRGWVAHDEGSLGQSAERLMLGELPHRDFDEIYTGGLSYVNAAAFRLFGITLYSMRVVLFAVFLAWIPAVFYVASRLVRPLAAAGVTLLCVVWTLPNYPAPLPSWYNLFLTVFGLAALFRWLEDRRPRWLVAAGVAGGLSLLVKIIALYFVAGVLLFLVFQAHEQSRAAAGRDARRGTAYSTFVTLSLLLFSAVLFLVVRGQLFAGEVVQFVLPGALIAGLLIRNEWMQPAGGSRERLAVLARLVGPFLLGFALPVALFLIPYARAGSLGAFFNGVFLLPSKRIGVASYRMLTPWSMLALVPVALLALYARRMAGRFTRWHAVGLAAVLVAYLVATARVPLLYRIVWYAVRGLLPVLMLAGVLVLARARRADADEPLLRAHTMLLLAVASVFTLVQFPFSVPIYFCYVAPLVILAALALLRYAPPLAPAVPAMLTAFLIGFAVVRTNTSTLFGMGTLYQPYPQTAALDLPRGGLEVPAHDAGMYQAAMAVLLQHAHGGYTWASPDCPEIYFLSGLRNPTRSLFDFFDEGAGRTPRILATLERHGVTAVVLNSAPSFTTGIPQDLVDALEARYPYAANVGKFHIRWQ